MGAAVVTLDTGAYSPVDVNAGWAVRASVHLSTSYATGGDTFTAAQFGLDRVVKVYSHAQSLAQCAQWLARHLPGAERVPVSSNAEAARLAALETGAAAIAGEIAAPIYGVAVLAPHIEDEPNNTTRFWVLGRQAPSASGRDETSLVMSAPNQPGAMHALLEPFARHGVSMSRIESRPARTGLWEYLFFVDLVGHRNDPPVNAALTELARKALFLKLLGSYPADQA